MKHFVYIIYSKSANRFYIGETVDPNERIIQHNSGYYDHASTKIANDWELYWKIECNSRKQALMIEKHIKKMRNRKYFENLKKYHEISAKLLEKYK